jgi:hypothetical protein
MLVCRVIISKLQYLRGPAATYANNIIPPNIENCTLQYRPFDCRQMFDGRQIFAKGDNYNIAQCRAFCCIMPAIFNMTAGNDMYLLLVGFPLLTQFNVNFHTSHKNRPRTFYTDCDCVYRRLIGCALPISKYWDPKYFKYLYFLFLFCRNG